MRLLLTRPLEDSEPLAAELRQRGHAVLLAPMLTIRACEAGPLDLDGVQGVLLTSANGARAVERLGRPQERNRMLQLPAYAVGEATARAARAIGFASVECADGDVGDLARLVAGRVDPAAGALLHIAGSQVAGDLAGDLGHRGFEVRRAVLYEAVAADRLSGECIAALRRAAIDAVLFFSPRTAATFARLVRESGLEAACRTITAFCLSPAVAERIAERSWAAVRVAERPEQTALLALLEEGCEDQP